MQAVLKESKQFKHALEWCLLASLLIHALIMIFIPKPAHETLPPNKQEIQIELVKEEPPAPALPNPEPEPTPPKPLPEPPKPQPVKPPPKPLEPKPAEPKPLLPQKASPLTETPS